MKKTICLVTTVSLLVVSGFSQEVKTKDSPLKHLHVVKTPKTVPPEVRAGFESIRDSDLSAYLGFLSSDLMEGRDTASRGYQIASSFVAALFAKWGIQPAGDIPSPPVRRSFFETPSPREPGEKSFFQKVLMKEYHEQQTVLTLKKTSDLHTKEITYEDEAGFKVFCRENLTLTGGVVFVGFGLDEKSLGFNEYRGLDVQGKFVLMFDGLPRSGRQDSPFQQGKLKEKYQPRRRSMGGFSKTRLAREKGALGVILIDDSVLEDQLDPLYPDDERPIIPGERRSMSLLRESGDMPWNRILTVKASEEIAQQVLSLHTSRKLMEIRDEIEKELRPGSFAVRGVQLTFSNRIRYRIIQSRNVLGILEGSDPELKEEVVIIGAHLDHLGMRGGYVFNGADDNGSGSVAVMEIAEAFALNDLKPKRSVLFALWTGEEKGLLGSRFYVQHPVVPMDQTVGCLNLDMVSRSYTRPGLKRMASRMFKIKETDSILEKIDINRFIAPSLAEKAPALYEMVRENNEYVGLHLFLRPSTGGMGGSDHAPFSMKGVPWVFFMAGFTRDYHQPTDSIEKVNTRLMRDITRLTYLTAYRLANQ